VEGAELPPRAELTAVQERRTRGRGAEPLRAKRVQKQRKENQRAPPREARAKTAEKTRGPK